MTKDPKTIAIWVLAIALIVVGWLWIQEKNRPDNIASFSEQMTALQADVKVVCADVSTEEKRNGCIVALEKVDVLLGEFFPTQKTSGNY